MGSLDSAGPDSTRGTEAARKRRSAARGSSGSAMERRKPRIRRDSAQSAIAGNTPLVDGKEGVAASSPAEGSHSQSESLLNRREALALRLRDAQDQCGLVRPGCARSDDDSQAQARDRLSEAVAH